MQTPFPSADSVDSLRHFRLWGVVDGGGGGMGGGGGRRRKEEEVRLPYQAYQPITCEEKELANRFYNGTLHTITQQQHKPTLWSCFM